MTEDEYANWLRLENHATKIKFFPSGMYAAVKPLMFHWTMIMGITGDTASYDDRWCYGNQELAEAALEKWDGHGDPEGWHRHPRTGRRRENGDVATEYVAF